jgi:two-component system chemotaxis response regulator CheY
MQSFLVVDDSPVIRKVARRILEDLGFAVAEAADAEEALGACRAAMPRAVLLDGCLPEPDGVEVLQKLRAEPGGKEPVVLFMHFENDVGQLARAMRAGATDYMMKPFDRDIMRAKLVDVGLVVRPAPPRAALSA